MEATLRAGARLAACALALLAAARAAGGACVGDCDGDGRVTIAELVTGVSVALGSIDVATCPAFDRDGDGAVRVDELLAAVLAASSGCAGGPTPTATPASGETRCRAAVGTAVAFDPTAPFCDLLSSYGMFRGAPAAQVPNDGVVPYDLNTPLFSDYALKHRFVWLPPGTRATYSAQDSFAFPVGAVLIKTFAYPIDARDSSRGQRLIETRLLVHRAGGWDPVTYVWNGAQTDATRRLIGADVPVSWIQADGSERSIVFHVPNANECKECHEEHDGLVGPLGPKARNLNKPYAYADGSANQLAHWTALGILDGAPDPGDAPRAAVFDDSGSGTIEQRARTYLDVNCGHCHNPSGFARTSGLFLDIAESEGVHLGICKGPIAAGQGTGGRKVDIAPGDPDASILTYRMESTAPGVAMPELGRQTVHVEAVALIREWIAGLSGACD
jgi:uncharacterized repeat protein (TIGR03806 family)